MAIDLLLGLQDYESEGYHELLNKVSEYNEHDIEEHVC